MNDVITRNAPHTNSEDEITLKQIFVEIDRLNGQMAQDRKDIERLRTETALLKVETRTILATLGVGV